MKKLGKVLKWLAIVLVVGLLLLVLGMRFTRGRASTPEEIRQGVFHVRNSFTDIYGVRAGQQVLVFDAGIDEQGRALDVLLAKLSATRDQVTDVYLGHGHFDHIAAAAVCPKAKIHVGIEDADMMARKAENPNGPARWFSRVFPSTAVNVTDALLERAEIKIGDETLLAIPNPGHTPGSYLFVFRGVLFASDSMQISGDKLEFAMAAFSRDMAQNKKSIAGLKALLGTTHIERVCTGHQACTPEGQGQTMLEDLIKRAAGI